MTRVRWTALALAMAALPAWAQEAQPPAEQTIHHVEAATPAPGKLEPFDAIDRNADGFLQWEEVRNQIVKLFLDSDRDGSGALAPEEFGFEARHRESADMNHDGKITQRELVAYSAAVFGGADLDNDEQLSRQEATDVSKKENLQ